MSLRYIGSENAIFTTSGQIFFDFAQSLRHRLLREPEHVGRLRLGAAVNAEQCKKLQVSLRQLAQFCREPGITQFLYPATVAGIALRHQGIARAAGRLQRTISGSRTLYRG